MTTETINLDIGGMTCQACANRIEKVLNKKPAILEATVNYANETAHVSFDDSQTNADEVLDWVKKTGYTGPHSASRCDIFPRQSHRKRHTATSADIDLAVFIAVFVGHAGHDDWQTRLYARDLGAVYFSHDCSVWFGIAIL